MIRFITALSIFLLLALSSCISTHPKVLGPLAEEPHSEAIHLHKAFLTLAGIGEDSGILKKMKSVEVVTCEDSRNFQDFDSVFNSIASGRNMELMVETKEAGETTYIYAISDNKKDAIKELLILTAEKSERSAVYIKGKIPLSELMENPKAFVN